MKIISYTCLHYGADYLASAIRSVIDTVDEHWILYSAIGSHGSRTDEPCPDTKDELYQIAKDAAGSKLCWRQSEWPYEGAQRDSIHQYAPDADVILTVDADEVWSVGAVRYAQLSAEFGTFQRYRVPMYHLWRSFYRGIMHDPAYPERIICPKKVGGGTGDLDCHFWDGCRIWHFGYSQRPEIVEYKQLTHGHRSEWRRDNWFGGIFMNKNAVTDLHPVGSQYWNTETIDPFALGLPEWMRNHPYANMQVIE